MPPCRRLCWRVVLRVWVVVVVVVVAVVVVTRGGWQWRWCAFSGRGRCEVSGMSCALGAVMVDG